MKKLAIIPARGGSKRIPRKNIKDFLGKPIITYSIQTALASNLFDEVMVSTDDEEIAKIAKELGAKVPFLRSKENSDDFATTADVIFEVIEQYEKIGRSFESVCCIYPTAPLITKESLRKGYELLKENNYDSVIPIVKFGFPIQRAVYVNTRKKVHFCQPEHINSRSQDLQSAYHDAGQFCWIKVEAFKSHTQLWTSNTGAIILSETEVQDIDNLSDWIIAENKYQYNKGNYSGSYAD
jgi:pseudaminic acid cytidylyltransferase